MVHHPIVLGAKAVVLLVIIVVLIILHGMLPPEQFRTAVFIGIGVFILSIAVIWAVSLILAVGAMREIPVVEDGNIVIGKRMKMTLSCDHKAVDGAMAAEFLTDLKDVIEDPKQYL